MIIDSSVVIERSLRTSISIRIRSDGTVIVKAPVFMTMGAIQHFLNEKEEWIETNRTRFLADHPKKKQFKDGETFLYLGNPVILTVGTYNEIHVKDNRLLFPEFLKFRIKKELTAWYIKQAKELITERVQSNAKQMQVAYKSISFSDTSSKWGSCSHDNHLQFCWRLIMSPLLVMNYVVIHELSHITEKNHSEDFWRRVRAFNPSYKQQIKWLKNNGASLVL